MAVSTKLTLSIDASVIVQAKAFARQRRKSLSRLVEEYLRYVSAAPADPPALSSRVLAIAESLEMPPGATYDGLKYEYLREKLLVADDADDADDADGAVCAQDPD